MKILKGFEALGYVLKNKDAVLYNRKGNTLRFDKKYNRLIVEPKQYMGDCIVINDSTIETEWYTENKKKILVKIYINDKLQEVQDHYFFDLEGNLEKLIDGIKVFYEKRVGGATVAVKYEMYGKSRWINNIKIVYRSSVIINLCSMNINLILSC